MSHPDQWSWVEWNNAPKAPQRGMAAPPGVSPAHAPAAARTASVDSNMSHVQRVTALRGEPPAATTATPAKSEKVPRAPMKARSAGAVHTMQAIDEEQDVVVDAGSNTLLYVLVGLLVLLVVVYLFLMWRTRKRNADNEKAVKAAQSAAESRAAQPPPVQAPLQPAAPAPQQPPAVSQHDQQPLNTLRSAQQMQPGGRVMLHTPDTAAAGRPSAAPQEDQDKRAQLLKYAHHVSQVVEQLAAGAADSTLRDGAVAARAHFGSMDTQTLVLWIQKHEQAVRAIAQREGQQPPQADKPVEHTTKPMSPHSHARVTALEEVPEESDGDSANTDTEPVTPTRVAALVHPTDNADEGGDSSPPASIEDIE